jgi:hypothetical protein
MHVHVGGAAPTSLKRIRQLRAYKRLGARAYVQQAPATTTEAWRGASDTIRVAKLLLNSLFSV